MRAIGFVALAMIGCGGSTSAPGGPGGVGAAEKGVSLAEARRGFQTRLARKESAQEPVARPPAQLFRIERYDSPAGKLAAYVTPDPGDGKKHPAIVWITGGDCNTIDKGCWTEGPPDNDQSAAAFRKAGIVMMFPSLRGGNDNPGFKEGFFGEVDDVLAAADFLAKQSYVDPQRIYLGGHSTGGTLALLTSEMSGRFRATFSFGPVNEIAGYGREYIPYDASNPREGELRAPIRWLHSIESPTFIFEGTEKGNLRALQMLKGASKNAKVHFYPVARANHFSVLAPVTTLIAGKILKDDGATSSISFSEDELNRLFAR